MMNLPPSIELVPPDRPVHATLRIPGSKSITNRALILAALAQGTVTLEGALWSEDTRVMVESLRRLGFGVDVDPDPDELANRRIRVRGRSGVVPMAGSANRPLELDVGNAGTAARFLAAFVCLGKGWYRLDGTQRMRQRPQKGLFDALRMLGHRVEAQNELLPARIEAQGPGRASCSVSIQESSQFASALLLAAGSGNWDVHVLGENIEESSYVAMTRALIRAFPRRGGEFRVEPDASSGTYFIAASHLLQPLPGHGHSIRIADWPESDWQIDSRFPSFLPLPRSISRRTDLGDGIMTAVVLAPLATHPVAFTDLGRLRLQECERVAALRSELTRCGARVEESGDTLTVYPSELHGAIIETYQDHRMAMCFATLGLHVAGLKIKNPACVAKTFPNFFSKLAETPPRGLGVRCLEGATGRPLSPEELSANP